MWMDHDSGWWIAMWLFIAMFWLLAAVAVWALLEWVRGTNEAGRSAEEIARRRFARGEISGDEYRAMIRELHDDAAAAPPGHGIEPGGRQPAG